MGFKWTVLVGKESLSKAFMATTIPTKGGMGHFGIDKCLEFIGENGDSEGDVIVKSDQESSAKFLIKEIVERRAEGRTLVEDVERKKEGKTMVE